MPPVEPPVKPTSTDTPLAPATAKPSFKERFSALMMTYGPLAPAIYLCTSVVSIAAFMFAISAGVDIPALAQRLGWQMEGTGETASTFFVAWLATKALQIPRMILTLALTPMVARIPFVARLMQRFWVSTSKEETPKA